MRISEKEWENIDFRKKKKRKLKKENALRMRNVGKKRKKLKSREL